LRTPCRRLLSHCLDFAGALPCFAVDSSVPELSLHRSDYSGRMRTVEQCCGASWPAGGARSGLRSTFCKCLRATEASVFSNSSSPPISRRLANHGRLSIHRVRSGSNSTLRGVSGPSESDLASCRRYRSKLGAAAAVEPFGVLATGFGRLSTWLGCSSIQHVALLTRAYEIFRMDGPDNLHRC